MARLAVGKSCVRFPKLEQLPLEVIGEAIPRTPVDDFIATYEGAQNQRARR